MILDGFGALGAPSQRETECCLAHHLPAETIFWKFRGGLTRAADTAAATESPSRIRRR
jgi:hypothetical protein